MRIGIDARYYGAAGRGQVRYIRCLVNALARSEAGHDFLLLGERRARPSLDLGPQARFVPAGPRLRMQYRSRLAGVRRLLLRGLDLVHFPLADGWYSRVGRSVVTIHDLSVLRYPEVYCTGAAAERRAWHHHRSITATADAVIVVSEATGRDTINLLGVPEERVFVVPNGVEPVFRPVSDPLALASLRGRYELPERYLLFVGGVDFKKNAVRLIEAFVLAGRMQSLPHALVMAGPLQEPGNPYFDAARDRAEEAGVADRLVWLGYVLDQDLPALYSGADALVYPSLMEGYGLPVLEAMACGTPVITSARSAMAEIAGDAAVYVDPLIPESIAEGILRLLGDEGLTQRLSKEGMRRAAAYSWERTAARTLEVYEGVLAGDRTLKEARA